jgi:hypothetical protein
VVVAVAQTDNYGAAPDNSAAAEDNFSAAAIRNSVEAEIDNCVAQNNGVPAGTDSAVALQSGWILVVGVALDVWVVTGWVHGANHCDDSAQSTAPPPKPTS